MQCKTKAPVRPAETSRGQRKTVAQFIPLPLESVKQVCPRIARRVQSRMIDRVAAAGWPWDAQVSLMVDALQLHAEETENRQEAA
jgi:hypothetical protein